MNNSLQDALSMIIQKSAEGLSAGVDFLSAQLPDVIRQLLLFNLAKSSAIFVVSFLAIVVYVSCILKLWAWANKKAKESPYDEPQLEAAMITALTAVIMTVVVTTAFSSASDVLELWLAPKVWLIEYAATLIKH